MKRTLLILFFISSQVLYAQKYSSIINDQEIIDFMTWLLTKDSIKTIQYLDNKIIANDIRVFIPSDSSKNAKFWEYSVFNKSNHVDSLISKNEAKYFANQIAHQKFMQWEYKFPYHTIMNYPKVTKDKRYNMIVLDSVNKIYQPVWAYSLPVFSVDKKKVIIIERFYCGIVCGGGSFNLYEKHGNAWRKLKEFSKWAN